VVAVSFICGQVENHPQIGMKRPSALSQNAPLS